MSYNGVDGRANWVGWTLRASDVGPVDRTNRFIQDESFPQGFKIADERDYAHSVLIEVIYVIRRIELPRNT